MFTVIAAVTITIASLQVSTPAAPHVVCGSYSVHSALICLWYDDGYKIATLGS